jgi:cytochrome c-type biogenesis protein CcmH/NrfF
MRRAFVLALCLVGALGLAPGANAETPEDVANRISGEVMSPYCPGVTLHDCPSDAAVEKRAEIEGWARSGWSEARIMAQLEEDFGDNIRANPTGTRGLWAWLIPAVLLVAGGIAALTLSRTWSAGRAESPSTPIASDDRRRIEAELQLLREESGR